MGNKLYKDLAKGRLPEKMVADDNEIGDVVKATNIFVEVLKKTADFAGEIGQGKLDAEFKPLSEEDTIGQSLLEMRSSLKTASQEEEIRTWKVRGLARFAELLRHNNDNIEEAIQIDDDDLVAANDLEVHFDNDTER